MSSHCGAVIGPGEGRNSGWSHTTGRVDSEGERASGGGRGGLPSRADSEEDTDGGRVLPQRVDAGRSAFCRSLSSFHPFRIDVTSAPTSLSEREIDIARRETEKAMTVQDGTTQARYTVTEQVTRIRQKNWKGGVVLTREVDFGDFAIDILKRIC